VVSLRETPIFQAKIHPFDILLAMENYKRCQSSLGKTTWVPSSAILIAMESAFYKSLQVGRGSTTPPPMSVDGVPDHVTCVCVCVCVRVCSFQNMEPTGKRFVVAVDISTSLSSVVPGTPLNTAFAAAAIALVRP